MVVWTIMSVGIGFLAFAIRKVIGNLGSENRENRLYERFYKQNKGVLEH